MTRQDVVSTWRNLITGRLRSVPDAWTVEDGVGGIRLSIEGILFDIEVLDVDEDVEDFGALLDAMSQDGKGALARDLDEAAEEAERDGPVPAEDLRRSLDEAIERGLEGRESETSLAVMTRRNADNLSIRPSGIWRGCWSGQRKTSAVSAQRTCATPFSIVAA